MSGPPTWNDERAGDRGAPRLCRGAPSVGGWGGPCRGPPRGTMNARVTEERHDFVGVLRALGGGGGPGRGPPRGTMNARGTEERPDFVGVLRALGGGGGHVGAPHGER